MSKQSQQIKNGAIISYIKTFVNIALTFFYTPWMIRQIGLSDYGVYGLVLALMSYFVLDFGLSNAIARFIAKYRAEGNEQKISNMLGLSANVYIVLSAIIFVALCVAYFFLDKIYIGLTGAELERLKVAYCIAGVFSVLTFVLRPMHGALVAFEYFVEVKTIDLIQRVGTIGLIVIVLLMGGGLYELVLINGASAFLCSLVMYYVFRKRTHIKFNMRFFDKGEMIALFSFSIWAFVVSLSDMIQSNMCPTILGIFSDSTEISRFSVSLSVQNLLYTISAALNGLFLPKVTRMIFEKKKGEINLLMARVGRIQMYIIGLIVTGYAIFGKPFIHLWLGPEFKETYYVILFIILPLVIEYTQHIAQDVVYAENRIKTFALITIATAVFSLLLACLFSPKMGAIGCGLAIGITTIIRIVIMNVFYSRKLKLDMLYFFKDAHLKTWPPFLVLAAIALFVNRFLLIDSWLSLTLCASIYAVAFTIVAYFIVFNKEEKRLVKSFIQKNHN